MDQNQYYEALLTHDSRFDGKFFVGVTTTGVYCRPVCRVRTPKAENCRFFAMAAEAEQAGFRPCLKCRPELAPGGSLLEARSDLLQAATREMENTCGRDESLEALSRRLGCTSRHLRRLFAAEFHVTPLQYRQTCRLLLAKKLLTDTDLTVLDVAMAAGFGSLRRFNEVFRRSYGMNPGALRQGRVPRGAGESFTVEVGYRPPYCWEEMLRFLEARAIPGVERVAEGSYLRTVDMGACSGVVRVAHRPEKNTLAVTVSASLLRVLPRVLSGVRRLFDTDSDPMTVQEALLSMSRIDTRLPLCGLRVPGCFNGFETAVRAILGQQITVKAATTLAGRVAEALGTPLETGMAGLNRLFPGPEKLLDPEQVAGLGVIGARARAIGALAQLFSTGERITREKLLALPGVGPWTADYLDMRVLGQTDAFLPTDAGVKAALAPRTKGEMVTLAQSWRPWRSYAVMNLWNL